MASETHEVASCWKTQLASQDANVDANVQDIHTTPEALVNLAMGMQQLSAKTLQCRAGRLADAIRVLQLQPGISIAPSPLIL